MTAGVNKKVVFLDRDGTLIFEPPGERLTRAEDAKLFPDTLEALQLLKNNGFKVIIITNQVGIAEGVINEDKFQELNNGVLAMLSPSGVDVLATYFCPHVPSDNCACRKPKPKMILEAGEKFNVDLSKTYMVGDRPADIGAGISAGTKTILIKTGLQPVSSDDATFTAQNLLEAAKYIVAH